MIHEPPASAAGTTYTAPASTWLMRSTGVGATLRAPLWRQVAITVTIGAAAQAGGD